MFSCEIENPILQNSESSSRNPESRKTDLLESGILLFGIQNPGLGIQNPEKQTFQNPESGIRNPTLWNPGLGIWNPRKQTFWNPESGILLFGIQVQESGIPENRPFGIRNPTLWNSVLEIQNPSKQTFWNPESGILLFGIQVQESRITENKPFRIYLGGILNPVSRTRALIQESRNGDCHGLPYKKTIIKKLFYGSKDLRKMIIDHFTYSIMKYFLFYMYMFYHCKAVQLLQLLFVLQNEAQYLQMNVLKDQK